MASTDAEAVYHHHLSQFAPDVVADMKESLAANSCTLRHVHCDSQQALIDDITSKATIKLANVATHQVLDVRTVANNILLRLSYIRFLLQIAFCLQFQGLIKELIKDNDKRFVQQKEENDKRFAQQVSLSSYWRWHHDSSGSFAI